MATAIERVLTRLPEAADKQALIEEYIQTITDRLLLRLGGAVDKLPALLESIVVDATVKMYRRIYYEGIEQEKAGELTAKFVDDVLAEYAADIAGYLANIANNSESRVVRFI